METIDWLDGGKATWEEIRDYWRQKPWAILPLGATEQHGPHLPQNTDTLLAQAVAAGVAQRRGGVVLPAMPVGYSWVWRDYPGSLTFSLDTFRAVVKDLARSLARNNCEVLLIISGHGANPQPLKYTIRELADELDMRIFQVFYPHLKTMISELESPLWEAQNFHAEEIETSMMLHLHADLVRWEKVVKEYPPKDPAYQMGAKPLGALSQSGVFGDATVASAAKGERWLAMWIDAIDTIWQELLEPNSSVNKKGTEA